MFFAIRWENNNILYCCVYYQYSHEQFGKYHHVETKSNIVHPHCCHAHTVCMRVGLIVCCSLNRMFKCYLADVR